MAYSFSKSFPSYMGNLGETSWVVIVKIEFDQCLSWSYVFVDFSGQYWQYIVQISLVFDWEHVDCFCDLQLVFPMLSP